MTKPALRGLELQFRTRSKIRKTSAGEALVFGFSIGPLGFFCIVNLPEGESDNIQPLVYVKLTLTAVEEWEVFKEHG